jgi:outer membrane protein
LALLAAVQASGGDTLRLSLAEAQDQARLANPTLRAERADARAAGAVALQASRGFLPSAHLDLSGVRTTDPVAVFGLKLRQGNFQSQDLALPALNDPGAYDGYGGTIALEQPIIAPEGWFGYAAARRAAAAGAARAERAAGATVFLVTQAYWSAQLAAARLTALDTALTAANGHADQAERMHEQGLVTGLDARLARVRAAAVEVQRLAALAEAENTRAALAATLALPDSTPLILTDALATSEPDESSPCTTSECSVTHRGDVRASRLGAQAAGLSVKRAWAAQLPQVAAFGTVAQHSATAPLGAGSGDWTIGIAVQWNVFQGLGGVGAVRQAAAERAAASARAEATEREAHVEVSAAERRLAAARASVGVAARAAEEARQALDQAKLRYRTGAAPITELLDVQAAATNATLDLLTARCDVLVARAALNLAYGVYDR